MRPRQFDLLQKYRKEVAKSKLVAKVKVKQHRAKKSKGFSFYLEANKLRGKSYKVFLKSIYWKKIKEIVLNRDGYKCLCGDKEILHVHHSTYKNHFNEHNNLQDLQTLCADCHYKLHCTFEIK